MISYVQSIANHSAFQSSKNGYFEDENGEFSKRSHFCFWQKYLVDSYAGKGPGLL